MKLQLNKIFCHRVGLYPRQNCFKVTWFSPNGFKKTCSKRQDWLKIGLKAK